MLVYHRIYNMSKTIKIPGYKIRKELGVGGMARVYLAEELKLERPVALKVLSPLIAENPRVMRRFMREAKIAAQMQHSNIVSIFDVGKHDGTCYIAMEYLTEDLKKRIEDGPRMRPGDALNILKEIAKALSYAHKKGFIHRDIKPDNIMFRRDGVVVLVDFGIVKALNENEKSRLTRTGTSIGTPKYMSPEQIKAYRIDGRSDIYSLGIVFFEMLTGEVPYKGDDVVTLAMKHLDEPVPQLPDRLCDFQPLIDKMLAKNPRSRVKDGEGLIRLIDALLFQLKARTERVIIQEPVKEKKSNKLLTFTASLLVIILITGSLYLIDLSKKRREESFWNRVLGTGSVAAYQQYLDKYPGGKFKKKADELIKVKKIEQFNKLITDARRYYRNRRYKKALQLLQQANQFRTTVQTDSLYKKIQDAMNAKKSIQ
jgi:serine/threonine protein kinase